MASHALVSRLNLPTPRGSTSNLSHPESRKSAVYIAGGICLPIIVIFATVRFYVKVTITKKIRWDDSEFNFQNRRFIQLCMSLTKS